MCIKYRSVIFCTMDILWCPDQVWTRSWDLEMVSPVRPRGAPVGVDSKTHVRLRFVPGTGMRKHHPGPFANWGCAAWPQKRSLQAVLLSLCLYLEMLLQLKSFKPWSFTGAGLQVPRGAGACSAVLRYRSRRGTNRLCVCFGDCCK